MSRNLFNTNIEPISTINPIQRVGITLEQYQEYIKLQRKLNKLKNKLKRDIEYYNKERPDLPDSIRNVEDGRLIEALEILKKLEE